MTAGHTSRRQEGLVSLCNRAAKLTFNLPTVRVNRNVAGVIVNVTGSLASVELAGM
jgi:hypothetical protein